MSASSSHPERAFTWIRKVKKDSDFDLLNDSEGFQSLDIKFAVALKKILPTVLKRRVTLMEEKWMDNHDTQMKGRQILVILFKWFQENEKDADFLTLSHLNGVELKNDDIEAFLDKWDEILHRMRKIPPVDDLLHLFRMQIKQIRKVKNTLHGIRENAS